MLLTAGGGLAGWATDLMASFGAPGAGIIVALENVFPPIPSEVILPLAGFAAGRGEFSVLSAIAWTTGGSVVGAIALYLVGMLAPEHRVRQALSRIPMVHLEDVRRAEAWFDRHGRWAVFLGRMVPGIRSLVSLPAGARRMRWWEFGLLTALGSLIWNTVFVYGGYALGTRWYLVERYSGVFQVVVLVLLVALVAFMLVKRYRRHRERVRVMNAPTEVIERPGR
ncbi:DedA family protein [Actinomycetospora chlora]|uniref:DedA family protein n=1 Tax=Actinomycetospora chlora TaxID=663608 RepID=A0ABP9AUS9_9PSEU